MGPPPYSFATLTSTSSVAGDANTTGSKANTTTSAKSASYSLQRMLAEKKEDPRTLVAQADKVLLNLADSASASGK